MREDQPFVVKPMLKLYRAIVASSEDKEALTGSATYSAAVDFACRPGGKGGIPHFRSDLQFTFIHTGLIAGLNKSTL